MKRVAILQSNYMPWKGYFDIIGLVDQFIFYDDVQFTKNDWRNRNIIKSPNGLKWLSIPCGSNLNRLICDVVISENSWQKSHLSKIAWSYQSAPYYKAFKDFMIDIYSKKCSSNLSNFNQNAIMQISRDIFGFDTIFDDSRNYVLDGKSSDRVLCLLKLAKATHYITGPSAKSYLLESDFDKSDIKIEYVDYSNYPEYNQLYPPFVHGVSVLDMIFNLGYDSRKYLKYHNRNI